MAWTYAESTQTKDLVRVLAGQTSSGDDVLVSDAFITFALSEASQNAYLAAAICCDSLAAGYAAQPLRESIGKDGLSWGDRAAAFRQQSGQLRVSATRHSATPIYVGGISESDKDIDEGNTDVPSYAFMRGQFDNPNVAGST